MRQFHVKLVDNAGAITQKEEQRGTGHRRQIVAPNFYYSMTCRNPSWSVSFAQKSTFIVPLHVNGEPGKPHTYIHTYIRSEIHTYIQTYIHTNTYMYRYKDTHTQIHIQSQA